MAYNVRYHTILRDHPALPPCTRAEALIRVAPMLIALCQHASNSVAPTRSDPHPPPCLRWPSRDTHPQPAHPATPRCAVPCRAHTRLVRTRRTALLRLTLPLASLLPLVSLASATSSSSSPVARALKVEVEVEDASVVRRLEAALVAVLPLLVHNPARGGGAQRVSARICVTSEYMNCQQRPFGPIGTFSHSHSLFTTCVRGGGR